MEDRAELLHHRIEAHRCYLATGADITLVHLFLGQIAADEAEMVMIEEHKNKPETLAGEAYHPPTVPLS
jgi:hypothetical protein